MADWLESCHKCDNKAVVSMNVDRDLGWTALFRLTVIYGLRSPKNLYSSDSKVDSGGFLEQTLDKFMAVCIRDYVFLEGYLRSIKRIYAYCS